jgi:osmotically-inducible protein OsmY
MRTAIVMSMALAFVACQKTDRNRTDDKRGEPAAANVPADNTKKNERDREPYAVTPENQSENETDRSITQRIRQNVVKDDDLSFNAKNVKIITRDGVVTLRGPVKDDQEKAQIATYAQRVEGVKKVDNQLEVARNQ